MHLIGWLIFFIISVNGSQKPHIVYPRVLEERSSEGTMVIRVHENLTLNLRKASVAAPTLRLLTEEKGKPVTHFYNGEALEKDLYEDRDNIASVIATNDHIGHHVQGVVDPRHRIEPMPVVERSEDGLVPHAIHEIEFEEMMDTALSHSEIDDKRVVSERQLPWIVQIPDTVNVEVFVVSDPAHHKHFPTNNAFLSYMCTVLNSANLRFNATSAPRIQLYLAGAELSQTYEFAALNPQNPKYAHDSKSLEMLKTYANKKKVSFGNPDVVYYISGLDMYSTAAGIYAYGIGYISSVCTQFFVALGEDKPGLYTGMHALTHEIAHVLGSEHDGDPPKVLGHPGAQTCPWNAGNIMSYVDNGPSHHQFSACSLAQMRYVVIKAGLACWKTSNAGYRLDGVFPGTVVNLPEYCKQLIEEPEATIQSATVTAGTCKVRCLYYKLQLMVASGYNYYQPMNFYKDVSVHDYTSCGEGKVCIQGICVQKPPSRPTIARPATVAPSKAPFTIPTLVPANTTDQCLCPCSSTKPTIKGTRGKRA